MTNYMLTQQEFVEKVRSLSLTIINYKQTRDKEKQYFKEILTLKEEVNASPPRPLGEFEFHDPRALVDYLAMPKRVCNIGGMLEKLLSRELRRGI